MIRPKAAARSLVGLVNLTLPMTVAGRRYRVPLLGGNIARGSEGWMTGLLKVLLARHDGAFVDVGVNLGQTLLKVKAIDPARAYLGFEPNPVCVAYVHRLVKANGLDNCMIVPAAAGEEPGVLMLDLYGGDANPGASLVPGFRAANRRTGQVPVIAVPPASLGSDILPGRIGLLKIDVEGGELEVMRAFVPLIERDRPVILLEVLPSYDASNIARIERQAALATLIREQGYAIHRVRKQGDRLAGVDAVEDFGIHGDLALCDYVLSPAEKPGPVL